MHDWVKSEAKGDERNAFNFLPIRYSHNASTNFKCELVTLRQRTKFI